MIIMGSTESKPEVTGEEVEPPAQHRRVFTEEEREHVIKLGTTSGCPGILMEAVESGNILDPAHMERARAMHDEWQRGDVILREVLARQRRMFDGD